MRQDYLIQAYKNYVNMLCTRSFEDHRQMPCNVLKESIFNDTKPNCKKCKYERIASDPGSSG